MKLIDAVEEAVRKYYNGILPTEAIEASEKEFYWTFDKFEEMTTESDVKEGRTDGDD